MQPHEKPNGNQGIYELVVYGNMAKALVAIEVIHYLLRRKVEPAFDWVFIILHVITEVSAAGTRVRMKPPEERTLHTYDAELLKAFCIGGFLIHIPVRIVRFLLWRAERRTFEQEVARREKSGHTVFAVDADGTDEEHY